MANPAELTVDELINRYSIRYKTVYIPGQGIVSTDDYLPMKGELAMQEKAYTVIAQKADEIAARLQEIRAEEKKQAEERLAAIAAIPGLDELKAAQDNHEYDALSAKYPKAAAYITADHWANSNVPVKVIAGTTARERIIAGENVATTLEDMYNTFVAHLENMDQGGYINQHPKFM